DGALILYNETPAHPYDVFMDLNGDGAVNNEDFTLDRSRIGDVLPGLTSSSARSAPMNPDLVDAVLGTIGQDDFSTPSTSSPTSVTIAGLPAAQKPTASTTGTSA